MILEKKLFLKKVVIKRTVLNRVIRNHNKRRHSFGKKDQKNHKNLVKKIKIKINN